MFFIMPDHFWIPECHIKVLNCTAPPLLGNQHQSLPKYSAHLCHHTIMMVIINNNNNVGVNLLWQLGLMKAASLSSPRHHKGKREPALGATAGSAGCFLATLWQLAVSLLQEPGELNTLCNLLRSADEVLLPSSASLPCS